VTDESKWLTTHERFQGLRVADYKAKSDYVCAQLLADRFVELTKSFNELAALRWLRGYTHALRERGESLDGEWSGCIGDKCKGACPLYILREAALSADVVVTTHSSLALLARDPDLSEWRATAVCVVDEADQFPKNLRLALKTTFRLYDLGWVSSDMEQYGVLGPYAKAIRTLVRDVDEMLDAVDFGRKRWAALGRRTDVQQSLCEIAAWLREARPHVRSAWRTEKQASPGSQKARRLGRLHSGIERVTGEVEAVLAGYGGVLSLHTVKREEDELYFAREPFVLGALEGGPLPDFHSVLYTSATLPDGDPSPFLDEVGAPDDAEVHRVGSHFDYCEMVSAALVRGLTAYRFKDGPSGDKARLSAVTDAVAAVARVLGGRTLVLSTSVHERDALASLFRGGGRRRGVPAE
jgi:Rad3-related DNA helicase